MEITAEEYSYGSPDPEVDIMRYDLQVVGFRLAGEEESGLETSRLMYELCET